MKICPKCQKTYTDQNLNFCLDDGSVLSQYGGSQSPPTSVGNPSPQLNVQQQPIQTTPAPAWNNGPQPGAIQNEKSSKTWIWVMLILGVLVIFCGGGFIGLLAYIGSQENSNGSTNTSIAKNTTTSSSPDPKNAGTSEEEKTTEKVDLSEWVRPFSVYGTTEMSGSDFVMSSKNKGFYYALAAPADTFQTENANSKVTLRNIDGASSRLGYGIVFHSDPTPLQQGYAFLIDTKKKKYRVVHHSPQKEEAVVDWKSSDSIKPGTDENTLEVRDKQDKIELYINGDMVNSIKNVYGFKGGVVGLYSGDAAKVAFFDLEVSK